eukprot:scaffold76638_cov54-Phaeocystis_antarctica.AAC.4
MCCKKVFLQYVSSRSTRDRAAWRSRSSSERLAAITLLVADPPTALAVTAEAASCAARAVLSEGMQTTRTARCVPADRFPDGVPGTGQEPNASPMTNASSVAA